METCVVNIDGEYLALGFDWTVPGEKKSAKQLVAQGQALGADIIASRKSQYGLGKSDPVDTESFFSAKAAAAVLEPSEANFAVLLHLNDLSGNGVWWVFARLNGMNIGMGDSLYRSELAARDCFDDVRKLMPSDVSLEKELVYDDPDEAVQWLSECVRHTSVLDILLRKGRCRKLAGWHGKSVAYLKFSILAAIIGAAVWQGAVQIRKWLTATGLTEAARVAEKQRAMRRHMIKTHPENVWDANWVESQMPSASGGACLAMVSATPIALGGWKYGFTECSFEKDVAGATAEYKTTAAAVYFDMPEGTTMNTKKPGIMHEARKMGQLPLRGTVEDHLAFFPQKYLETWILQFNQIYRVKARVKFKKREVYKEKKLGTFDCPWIMGEFTIGNVPTAELLAVLRPFDKLPGAKILYMKHASSRWTIKGVLHAK